MKMKRNLVASRTKRLASLGLFAGVVLAAVGAPSVASAAPSDAVVFPDAGLEACVVERLNLPEGSSVTEAEIAKLPDLSCRDASITDISGLSFATGLKSLDLAKNNISDLGPLAQHPTLSSLILVGNQVSELSPLSGVTTLTELFLNNNRVSDLGPLAGLTNMRALMLHSNQVSDLTPLSGMSKLETLYVPSNAIADLSPLGELPKLRTFNGPSQRLAPIEATTGVPMSSPVVALNGEPVPLNVDPAKGEANGSEVTWAIEGQASASWTAPFALGSSTAQFSGAVPVNVTPPPPEVSLVGVPLHGVVGTSYSFNFVLDGKPSIPEITEILGSLPPGLTLSRIGELAGTPTRTGTFEFEVTVANGAAEKNYLLSVVITDSEDGDDDGDGGEPGGDGGGPDGNGGGPDGNGGGGAGETGGRSPAPLAQSGSEAAGVAVGITSTVLLLASGALLVLRRRIRSA